jgi:glutathione S-transferase
MNSDTSSEHTRKLFDLVGNNDQRSSPYCWRAKLSLAHKNLDAEIIPVKFTEKAKLEFSGQTQVPILVDGKEIISDSWRIACYLEDNYPDQPALIGNTSARNLTQLFHQWFDKEIIMSLFPMIVPDNYKVVHPDDKEFYRESREAWLGKTLEQLDADRSEEKLVEWKKSLEPIRTLLRDQLYLGGSSPLFSDYVVFSMFMWARTVSPWPIITQDDDMYPWRERMLDLYDGMPRKNKAFEY